VEVRLIFSMLKVSPHSVRFGNRLRRPGNSILKYLHTYIYIQFRLRVLHTKDTKQSPSSEHNSSFLSQQVHSILRNPESDCPSRHSPPLVPVLSHIHPVYAVLSNSFNDHFYITSTLSSHVRPGLPNGRTSLYFALTHQNPI
jgi:hypothetical protein